MVRRPERTRRNAAPPSPEARPTTADDGGGIAGQLDRLQGQLNRLRIQVRQAQQLAGLGTAAAMIAHEFSNLLTPIRSYAQAALDADDAELHRKALTVTLKNARMLTAMSERVLEISAAKPPDRQAVALRTTVDDAVASLCRDLGKDGIRLALNLDDSLTVWGDPLQLQQVFFNLFLNARNAMSPSHNGRLTVSGATDGDRVVVKVKDTGPGIPPDLLPHVFDPLQTSKPLDGNGQQRCAGLGLALCRDLIEENAGTIAVASEPGIGTTFTITLPAPARTTP